MKARKVETRLVPVDGLGEGFYVAVYVEPWQSFARVAVPAAKRAAVRFYGGRRMALVNGRPEDREIVGAVAAGMAPDDRTPELYRFTFIRPDGTIPA